MSQGFYRSDGGDTLIYAPNYVDAPDYTLVKELKDTYQYPIQGWLWFDSEGEALKALENGLFSNLNGWHSRTCNMRIVAPITLVNTYPQLLFDLTVVRKLQVEKSGDNMLIYCNFIEPEHQSLIDSSKGVIYVETKV